MPYTFEYFMEYLFPENSKLKTTRKTDEVRREGYFPEDLEIVMREQSGDRLIFERNHKGQ